MKYSEGKKNTLRNTLWENIMWEAKQEGIYTRKYVDRENDREEGSLLERIIFWRKETWENYELSQINTRMVELADISVARLDIMIKSGLTNESLWSIQDEQWHHYNVSNHYWVKKVQRRVSNLINIISIYQ